MFKFLNKKSPDLAKKEQELKEVEKLLQTLNETLDKAKRDLGDITVNDVIEQYNRGLISKQQAGECINSIQSLEKVISGTPEMIKNTEIMKAQILEELKKMEVSRNEETKNIF